MIVKFKFKQLFENVYVITSNQYDLSMIFCRAQEFYESPKFKNKKFSIWDYFRWYSLENECFSYTKDFEGYNIPVQIAKLCYKLNKVETPYDEIFIKLINTIKNKNSYLIGVSSLNGITYKHELCHAFYYLNYDYKKSMDEITKKIEYKKMKIIEKKLSDIGYHKDVFKDEVQAYMATEAESFISKGLGIKKLHYEYKKVFENFYIKLKKQID